MEMTRVLVWLPSFKTTVISSCRDAAITEGADLAHENLLVSVSGGRTSMFMAIWIWLNWRNKYRTIIFVFANTGAEHPLTLKFVDTCAYIWGIPIVWVEAAVHPTKGIGTKHNVVTYETASRSYEPFDAVVKKYGIANQSYKHCNRELKLAPIHSYACDVFGGRPFENYETAIGIRVDEIDRMAQDASDTNKIYPLVGVIPTKKYDVLRWWKEQVYDLEIPEHYGNCVTCFKKSDRKLATISIENPEWFDKQLGWEFRAAMIGSKDGNPRKIYRSNKSVQDIFDIGRQKGFDSYRDENFIASDSDLDIEQPCSLDCGLGQLSLAV